jgi:hypothetical protein
VRRRFRAASQVVLSVSGSPVDHPHPLAVARHVHALHATFAGERELGAVWAQHLAHHRFAGTETVQRRGVEVRNASIQRGQQQPLGLGNSDTGAP